MALERFSRENNPNRDSAHYSREEPDERAGRVQSRRSFLKWGAAAFGAAFGASRLYSLMQKHFEEPLEAPEENLERNAETLPEDETVEVIPFDSEEPITLAHIEKLKNKWKNAYTGDSIYKESLKIAQRRIRPFDANLREAFSSEDVPEFLRHLAIPESHGHTAKRSNKGAVGMFQITRETAETYGMVVSNKDRDHDDRSNPIKSGRVAARVLKDIARVADGDWSIALAGYNGGFIWEYLEQSIQRKESLTYENFLKFLNEKIRRIRSEVKRGQIMHAVKKKETISGIATQHGITERQLMSVNHLSSDKIYIGQKLTVPLSDSLAQRRAFRTLTSGFRQNIEYVPKVYAVAELLDNQTYFKS